VFVGLIPEDSQALAPSEALSTSGIWRSSTFIWSFSLFRPIFYFLRVHQSLQKWQKMKENGSLKFWKYFYTKTFSVISI
jgi:hypothetical protein